jgi:hypothetical protein
MWPFIKPIKLIRYLFVWRVNRSLAQLPRWLPAELSLVIGTLIANRLPTRQAHPWRKALAPWEEWGGIDLVGKKKPKNLPQASWPVEAVLFAYPGKQTYGQGELILWELKLLGDSADHGLFLEVILPAIEEAGSVTRPQWQHLNTLWGRFDIQAIYAARGPHWEPIANNGQLDLSYRATPSQWAEGLAFDLRSNRTFDRLTWLTPFDLSGSASDTKKQANKKKIAPHQMPTLSRMLESLIARLSLLLPGKHNTPDDVWAILSAEEQTSLRSVIEQASHIPMHRASLVPVPRSWAGRWIGTQTFASIPHPVLPYLELASILHIGRHTHLGCGTFAIS